MKDESRICCLLGGGDDRGEKRESTGECDADCVVEVDTLVRAGGRVRAARRGDLCDGDCIGEVDSRVKSVGLVVLDGNEGRFGGDTGRRF